MKKFAIGQRWISEMEPELGLGIIRKVDQRIVHIEFPASQCQRSFAMATAPLRRVAFNAGDIIVSKLDSIKRTVVSREESQGLITYHGEGWAIPENDLCDQLSFTTPQDRLLNQFFDRNEDFVLRYRALMHQYRMRKSPLRGFAGGRIDLIPHQLYVAHAVTSLQRPRVLLSDETGLGKTIEACLILHRLLITERINRVLICVPPALLHQWFVELLRRFNLSFRIFDEAYCQSLEATQPGLNPFAEESWILCAMDFLTQHPQRQAQATAAGWDMLVIDEAHHLHEESQAYRCAQELCGQANAVLLITATPEQLGHRSHFARLRLLDPARYHDFIEFEREENRYQVLVELINALMEEAPLNERSARCFAELTTASGEANPETLLQKVKMDPQQRQKFIHDIVDRHGTGRAVFRNVRADLSGYPKRLAHLIALEAEEAVSERIQQECRFDMELGAEEPAYDYRTDPRLHWLAQFLRKHRHDKILVICRTAARALTVAAALKQNQRIDAALFHENLTLLQRDRNASWFAQADGPHVLISSEIGSEGRNFQFCHHLVLFDLPRDPELLEQRIGRLDRIGQQHAIQIHVPYVKRSGQEVLARWYEEGLGAFTQNIPGVYILFEEFGSDVQHLAAHPHDEILQDLIDRTQVRCQEVQQIMQRGRDRLLALNSYRPEVAARLQTSLQAEEAESRLEKFMLAMLSLYGIRADEIGPRTWQLNLTLLNQPEFPLPAILREKLVITFDRAAALRHEEIEFLSWDHPMVVGALDLLVSSEKGNCSLALWAGLQQEEYLLETVYLLESVAPKRLQCDRYLPPVPVRIVIDQNHQFRGDALPVRMLNQQVHHPGLHHKSKSAPLTGDMVPALLASCQEEAGRVSKQVLAKALQKMENALTAEIERLKELRKDNGLIRDEEITLREAEREALHRAIAGARLRLDSLRLILPTAEGA